MLCSGGLTAARMNARRLFLFLGLLSTAVFIGCSTDAASRVQVVSDSGEQIQSLTIVIAEPSQAQMNDRYFPAGYAASWMGRPERVKRIFDRAAETLTLNGVKTINRGSIGRNTDFVRNLPTSHVLLLEPQYIVLTRQVGMGGGGTGLTSEYSGRVFDSKGQELFKTLFTEVRATAVSSEYPDGFAREIHLSLLKAKLVQPLNTFKTPAFIKF